MKIRNVALILAAIVFSLAITLHAAQQANELRPHMGIRMDATALPEILIKHLRLSPDQGVRIKNVYRGSPADRAGLERDDIIIALNGEKIEGYEGLIKAVRGAGVGARISLQIIHLGQRETVEIELEPFTEKEIEWKYPAEPQIAQSWRPGRMFRLKPGEGSWIEIPFHDIPKLKIDIDKFFKELYCYQHLDDGESYSITIEGDPNDEDTTITVRTDKKEYKTTVKEMDRLPEKYRAAAEEALQNARKSAKAKKYSKAKEYSGKFSLPSVRLPSDWRQYFENLYSPNRPSTPSFSPSDQMFDRGEKQMRKLQERIEALEKHHSELLDRLSDEADQGGSKDHVKSTRREMKKDQKV